jgi:hypothetical protein
MCTVQYSVYQHCSSSFWNILYKIGNIYYFNYALYRSYAFLQLFRMYGNFSIILLFNPYFVIILAFYLLLNVPPSISKPCRTL